MPTLNRPKLKLASFQELETPAAKHRLAPTADAEARQRIREEEALKATLGTPPEAPPTYILNGVSKHSETLAYKPGGLREGERWVELSDAQCLKIISETRLNRPKRILRVELWDSARAKKFASFYRRF